MTGLICNKRPRRSKNVTVGQQYEGAMLDRNGNLTNEFNEATHFVCINNAGIEARYEIGLFGQIVVPEPEPIPKLGYQEIINKLIFTSFYNGEGRELQYKITYDNRIIIDSLFSVFTYNTLSCGIKQCGGLEEMLEELIDVSESNSFDIEGFEVELSDLDKQNIVKHCVKMIFESILDMTSEDLGTKFLAFSNTDEYDNLYWDVLNELSITDNARNYGVNPNSGANIAVWIFKLEDGE